MAKTRFYSMIISIPDDHRKHSTFTFSKYWNIISIPAYLGAVRTLREHTRRDGKGRILCTGKVGYSYETQERLYIVKLGHDKIIWQKITPLGNDLKEKLATATVVAIKAKRGS